MDKKKSRKNARSENKDNELDLSLRLSALTHEEQNVEENRPTTNFHDFLGLGGGNSNDELPPIRYSDTFAGQHSPLPMSDWGGSVAYGGSAAGLLVAPLRPIAMPTIRCSESSLSSQDQGFLPSTGFATPSRKRPTVDDGRLCQSCGTRSSPLWRRGPGGPQTLCNKCELKHARYLKRGLNE